MRKIGTGKTVILYGQKSPDCKGDTRVEDLKHDT